MTNTDHQIRSDVENRDDVDDIVTRFYEAMLKDPIVGYIFTDVAKIDLTDHLPLIVDFWSDILFKEKQYSGNVLAKHLQLNQKLALKPGHFTRWLYLFSQAVDAQYTGHNADRMKQRAESVAKTISAKISEQKRADMKLTLSS